MTILVNEQKTDEAAATRRTASPRVSPRLARLIDLRGAARLAPITGQLRAAEQGRQRSYTFMIVHHRRGRTGDDHDVPSWFEIEAAHRLAQPALDPITDDGRADALADGVAEAGDAEAVAPGAQDKRVAAHGAALSIDGGEVFRTAQALVPTHDGTGGWGQGAGKPHWRPD